MLFYLFVDPVHQRKGFGRKLSELLRNRAIQAGHSGDFTVPSSLVAVPVYERFGFKVTGERIDKNGGAFVPMKYEPQRPAT